VVYTSDVTAVRGQIQTLRIQSERLRGNSLGDPHERALHVYLPSSYDASPGTARFPVIYLLAGFTGSGASMLNWTAWQENLPAKLDRLIGDGAMAPCIVVFPDCFTRLGGSQYVNSTAMGRYEDYLCDEVVPFVDEKFRTLGARGRGIAGKSSGGYGALWLSLQRPGLFAAAASHSGDCAFELCMDPHFGETAMRLQQLGGMAAFWKSLQEGYRPTGADTELMQQLCNAAAYSPAVEPNAPAEPWGFALPFDPETALTRPEVAAHWRKFDPLHAVTARPEGFRRLSLLYIDVGRADEYLLQFGARLLCRELDRLGIGYRYEEFEGGHRNTSHRYDVSLPALSAALSGAP
jgi:enterochelin esterase-like enzyme